MAHTKLYGKDLKAYQDVDLDALLAKLTDAELEELHTELIDPDVCKILWIHLWVIFLLVLECCRLLGGCHWEVMFFIEKLAKYIV